MDDRRRRKKKWSDDLFSCHNPFESFALIERFMAYTDPDIQNLTFLVAYCASNFELVEPLPEPERTLNRRLRRKNRRVPFEQRNNLPQHPRIVYPPISDINYFQHFVELLNRNIMDDQPMWAADRVVAPTSDSAITLLATANEFAIKGEIRAFSQHEGETLTDAWLRMKEMLRNCRGHNLPKGGIIKIFYHGLSETTQEVFNAAADGPSKTDTEKIMARMDAMTMKMDAQLAEKQSGRPSGSLPSNTQPNPRGNNSKAYQPPQSRNEHVNVVFTRSGKTYDSPMNPNEQQGDAEIFDSDDEDEEPTPQPKPQPTKETPTPKPYKPKIPYP
ncbi:hypothetical protein Tco_0365121 [Tanacetum coccineum]